MLGLSVLLLFLLKLECFAVIFAQDMHCGVVVFRSTYPPTCAQLQSISCALTSCCLFVSA